MSQTEESFGFIDSPHSNLPLQMRSTRVGLSSKDLHESRPPLGISPVTPNPSFWDISGNRLHKTQQIKRTDNVVHDLGDLSRLKSVKLPHLFEMEDDSMKPHVALDDMHKELQNTLHQLKVLHAFPPGSNFEDEHSGLVKAILVMTKQLATLKDSHSLHDAVKPQSYSNQVSVNDLRELVSRIFSSETVISAHQHTQEMLQSDSSLIFCTWNNLFCCIRECLTKARSDWSSQYKHLEEQFLKSCQEIKAARHEAADAIHKATAQYKDADLVWESNHSHHLITIGNLREQLHNITVRYSNLQVESKSEQESQGKEFRQQISHLQGQVTALKKVAESQTFHNAEETRRYEALSVEHDKLLQTLSILPLRDEQNDALSSENSKLQLILEQKQADYDSLASKYSNLQVHFSQLQSSFQQLVSNTSSSSKEVMLELRGQISELLADQQRKDDALNAGLRANNSLENKNERLKQLLDDQSRNLSAKDDEIRQHELFQLSNAESESRKLQECTSILLEARNIFQRTFPNLLQDTQNEDLGALQHADFCDLIRSDMTIILERQLTLEKLIPDLRHRIKTLRTQAKVASSQALKDIEDRIYEVENAMDHTVDAHLRQHVVAAVDRAKSQLRDLNVAHEHHHVMGMQDINDQLHQDIMGTTIRDRSLRAKVSAIFELNEQSSGRHPNR